MRGPSVFPARRVPALLAALLALPAALPAAVFHVDAVVGSNGAGCGSTATPCATIQHAINISASGDTILVAAGTYLQDPADATCTTDDAVVCVFNTERTILGGFGGGDWSLPDPQANPTIIDGEDLRHGVVVRRTIPTAPPTSIRMEGFTIRNGYHAGTAAKREGFGGGMLTVQADVILRDMVFENNVCEAWDASSGAGGDSAGGGASIRSSAAVRIAVTLERITFNGNESYGGDGVDKGGFGEGGGLFIHRADFVANDLTFENNLAQAGSATGNGSLGGKKADALGGGLVILKDADGVIDGISVSGNTALGGGATTNGGGAFGGGIYIEKATVEIIDGDVRDNAVIAANSDFGGFAAGGGILTFESTVTLRRMTVVGNRVRGGNGPTRKGSASGGGGYFSQPDEVSTVEIYDSIFADNMVELGTGGGSTGGGGGGVTFTGIEAIVSHTTFARNTLNKTPLVGQAVAVVNRETNPADAQLLYSAFTDHTSLPNSATVEIRPGSSATFDTGIFAGNSKDTNAGTMAVGTINGLGTMTSVGSMDYVSPGAPDFDYHLQGSSPAIDQATGSSAPTDHDGAARDGSPDIGADEFGADAHRLIVRPQGVGAGAVSSSPAGISCGGDCTEVYPAGTAVDLDAAAAAGSFFMGWAGDSDCDDGSLAMSTDVSCDAIFVEATPGTIVVEKQTDPGGAPEQFWFNGAAGGEIGDGGQIVASGLAPGVHLVTEVDHPQYDLTSIVCDDANSSGNVGSLTATVQLEPAETVTCTFTNTATVCGAAENDLDLPDQSVTIALLEQACISIGAGPYTIEPTGHATFEAGDRISLRNGFSAAGDFTAFNNVPSS